MLLIVSSGLAQTAPAPAQALLHMGQQITPLARENRAELFARYQESLKKSPKADNQRARYAPFITKLELYSRCSKSTLSLGPQ